MIANDGRFAAVVNPGGPVNKKCSTPDCGQPAVAWYDYGNGHQWACVTHNPFRNMTVNAPPQGGDLCPTCNQPWRVSFT